MHPAGHLGVSTLAALVVKARRGSFPWLAWASSLLADVDHLAWHANRHERVDPVTAWRYFRSEPADGPEDRLPLHRYEVIAAALMLGRWLHPLQEVAMGLAFHRLVDDATDLWVQTRRAATQRRRERLRATVFAREKFTCQGCGRTGEPLELHHRVAEADGGRNVPNNLMGLCRTCHDKAHGRVTPLD